MTKILIVDDEREIADLVELFMENENYEVRKFYEPAAALDCVASEKIDLALLDVMMPVTDGFSMLREIRKQHTFPVIMLTAKEQETDKITGLALGADDYITKPFRPLELVARVKAQLRRSTKYNSTQTAEDEVIEVSGLVLNSGTHECTLNGRELMLTPTEFSILWLLCANRGQVMGSERLFREIWKEEYYNKNNNTITVHIRHIREKMGDTSERPRYIKTVWGVGYKIEK